MWQEAGRFRVRDEHGRAHMLVWMTRPAKLEPLHGRARAASEESFYFLLGGPDVTLLPDGRFLNNDSGQVLVRE